MCIHCLLPQTRYTSGVYWQVYMAPNLLLIKTYSAPQFFSTYCVTLEGFDGPILS